MEGRASVPAIDSRVWQNQNVRVKGRHSLITIREILGDQYPEYVWTDADSSRRVRRCTRARKDTEIDTRCVSNEKK